MISKRHRYDQGQYAILPREAINNSRLSFAARGLLLYLLEKPADWMVSNEHLYAQSPAGERHINTVLAELKAAGYVHREKVYDPPTRTFRWDTTVYDFPEDNPHYQPDDAADPPTDRIPTPRIPTFRMDTKRKGTKRSDDLILDLPILNEDIPPPRAKDAAIPEPLAVPLAPLAETEDEFYAAARAFDDAARVARLARMSPDARRRAEALEQMVETLAEVTDTTVKANRSRLESVAAKIDEFTPEQVRRGFGDPQGWWWQEWYKGRERRQKPTLYDIQEYVKRAAEWTPPAVQPAGTRSTSGSPAGDGRIDAAWAAVLRAIRRTADNRAVMNGLDDPAQAGVRAAGNLSTLRNMRPGVDDRTIRARFAAGYREALDRAALQPAQAAAD